MICRSFFLKFILYGILIFGVGLVVLHFVSYKPRQNDLELTKKDNVYVPSKTLSLVSIKSDTDFKSNTKPEKITAGRTGISAVPIRKYKISINNEKNQNIFVRETGAGNYHVLLLHGGMSSSQIWEKIGTLQYLSNWGYRAFAIDIPSITNGSVPVKGDIEAVQWLTLLIRRLNLSNLVIISPSLSGRLSLPYILQIKGRQELIRGYVPIAPVGTNRFKDDDYKKVKIPTLIVHGEKDTKFQSAFETLKQIPTGEIFLMKNVSHASYYENPIEFHDRLRQFLYKIYQPIYKKPFKLPSKNPLLSKTTNMVNKKKTIITSQSIISKI